MTQVRLSSLTSRMHAPVGRGLALVEHDFRRQVMSVPEVCTASSRPGAIGGCFEALLLEIGSELQGALPDAVDAAFSRALARLIAFLDVERAVIALPDPVSGMPRVAHCVAADGVPRVPIGLRETELPWLTRQLRAHRQTIVLSTETAAHSDAAIDVETVRRYGMKSVAFLPLTASGQLMGVLSLGSARAERSWPLAVVERLRVVAGLFAGACLRVECERRLSAALLEAQTLRACLRAEPESSLEDPFALEGFDDIIGESPALRDALFMVEQVAPTDAAVLLQGETGTGKELIAQAIHAKSHRRGQRLVKVNCAALPPTLIESDLFGHEKGAFTGAASRKIGRFELADRGTLFLDEIGELPLEVQAKLLRVLQDGEFERVGSTVTRKVDVRVIAASNRDLTAAVREGGFRSDMYYRLSVFPIKVPSLRARKDDIPLLVWHFLGQLGATLGRKIERVPVATMQRLVAYDWPGNIRELRNVLERAIILSRGTTLTLDDQATERRQISAADAGAGGVETLEDIERQHILRVLELCAWRVRGPRNAAQQLGLNASTLYSRMKKLGIRRAVPTRADDASAGHRANSSAASASHPTE